MGDSKGKEVERSSQGKEKSKTLAKLKESANKHSNVKPLTEEPYSDHHRSGSFQQNAKGRRSVTFDENVREFTFEKERRSGSTSDESDDEDDDIYDRIVSKQKGR